MSEEPAAIRPEEQLQDETGWRQLAEDAAQWPEDHKGLQALRQNHVNRILGEKGLGHLAVDEGSGHTSQNEGVRHHKFYGLDQEPKEEISLELLGDIIRRYRLGSVLSSENKQHSGYKPLGVDVARALIAHGEAEIVAKRPREFFDNSDHDIELAEELIDLGAANEVLNYPSDFKGLQERLDRDFAQRLIAAGHIEAVAKNARYFTGLTEKDAHFLIDADINNAGYVVAHSKSFTGFQPDKSLFLKMAEHHAPTDMLGLQYGLDREKLKVLDEEVADAFIRNGNGKIVYSNPEQFNVVPSEELALRLLATNVKVDDLLHSNSFKGVLGMSVLEKFIEEGEPYRKEELEKRLDHFCGLNADSAMKLVSAGYGAIVISCREKFQGLVLDEGVADLLISTGQWQEFLKHKKLFEGITFDHALFTSIIEAGKIIPDGKMKVGRGNWVPRLEEVQPAQLKDASALDIADGLAKIYCTYQDYAAIRDSRYSFSASGLDLLGDEAAISHPEVLFRYPRLFGQLSGSTGDALIAQGQFDHLYSLFGRGQLGKFKDRLSSHSADLLLAAGDESLFLRGYLKNCFESLSNEFIEQCLESGRYLDDIVSMADRLPGLTFDSRLLNALDKATEEGRVYHSFGEVLRRCGNGVLTAEDVPIFLKRGFSLYDILNAKETFQQTKEFGWALIKAGWNSIGYFEELGIDLDSNLALELAKHGNGQTVIAHAPRFNSLNGAVLDKLVDRQDISALESILFYFQDISDETLAKLREVSGKNYLREYPRGASEKVRDRWFGEMSYAYLQGGFNKASIGHVIRLRIEGGLENNIHDASQWLAEFGIPEKAYDIQAILREREQVGFDPEGIVPVALRDARTERDFFSQLAALPVDQRARLNFSGKDGVAEQMFYNPEHQLLYTSALQLVEGTPYYKRGDFSIDGLFERAHAATHDFSLATAFGRNREETTHSHDANTISDALEQTRQEFDTTVESVLSEVDQSSIGGRLSNSALSRLKTILQNATPTARQVSQTVGELKAMGQARRAYTQDAQRWLERHAHSPHERLTKVWADRGLALAYGTSDGALAIEGWQTQNAIRLEVNRLDASGELQGRYGFTKEEIMAEDNADAITELSRRLSSKNTLEAMGKMKRWRESRNWDEKLLPAAKIDVKLGNLEDTKGYRFEVLGKDDPRGFTIGEDTGCCMTIHGASNSCIKAGYKERNAGFVAMYAPDGRLAAQSFWYVNPSHPHVLVMDNIEANEGRDFSKVLKVYKQALQTYLVEKKELGITRVHIGTGYTQVDLGGLKKATPVPALSGDIYSDATHQKLLLDMS